MIFYSILYDPWGERFIHRHFNGLPWFRDDLYFVHARVVEEKNQHVQHCIFVAHGIATKLKIFYKVLKFQGLANASSWSVTLGIGHTKYVDIYILNWQCNAVL